MVGCDEPERVQVPLSSARAYPRISSPESQANACPPISGVRALVWHGAHALALEELPEPVPARDEVVLDVELAGICGSDLHGYRGHPGPRVPPLVLGHEVVGHAEGGSYTVYPLLACGVLRSLPRR
jgi:hypothetical protein